MTSPTASDYTYESESEFDLALRDARGRVPRDRTLTPARVQQAFTPLISTTTMSSPAGVGQPTGNPNLIDQAMALSGITVSALPPLTPTSPAGVGSASNQPISDLFDAQEEAEEEAARRRQQRRIQAARGKRPAARGRPSVSGTTTTTTRLPARRPRRPVLAPTPPPRGASSPRRGRGRGRLPSVSPGRSFTSSSPGSPSSVRAAAEAANEGDLQQVFQILANDVNNRVQNRRISGITTTNTVTTVYKNGRPPSVRRNSTRIST